MPGEIGLALSGGGARAIAFQLGCMKALDELGLLSSVTAISSVSGGSVLAGLYCAREETFEEFETRTRQVLRRGVLGHIAGALVGARALNALLALAVSGTAAASVSVARAMVAAAPIRWDTKTRILRGLVSPIPRWATRTDALEGALRGPGLLGPIRMRDLPSSRPKLIINAADLRTQTAFRFSADGAGTWRHGAVVDREFLLSEAVAASAAFPVLLPAIERRLMFELGGVRSEQTVVLTDGGIYDNLGIKAFHPTRPDRFSFGTRRVTRLIACVAEPGVPEGSDLPRFLLPRMKASFATAHRQLHTSGYSDLHEWQAGGSIEGFIMPYLGQDDSKIASPSSTTIVPLGELAYYPADFNPMPESAVDGLIGRGYSLTHAMSELYL